MKRQQNGLLRSVVPQGPLLWAAVVLIAVSSMSNLWANGEFRELNLVPIKVKAIFPIHLPSLWFVPTLILLIRKEKYCVVSKSPNVMSCGNCTAHITAV